MYYCDKCGEVIKDTSMPCPTCGMMVESSQVISNNSNNKIFNILMVLIAFFGIIVGTLIFTGNINYSNEEIEFTGKNYSIFYDGEDWIETDLNTNEYYVLQNVHDLNAFLQIPVVALELNLNIANGYDREGLHASYSYLLKNDTNYNYHNITSEFMSLKNTNNYYMSSDFYKYSDSSLKGKVFILVSPQGKTMSIVLKKGSKSISSLEDEVYELLEDIEI